MDPGTPKHALIEAGAVALARTRGGIVRVEGYDYDRASIVLDAFLSDPGLLLAAMGGQQVGETKVGGMTLEHPNPVMVPVFAFPVPVEPQP